MGLQLLAPGMKPHPAQRVAWEQWTGLRPFVELWLEQKWSAVAQDRSGNNNSPDVVNALWSADGIDFPNLGNATLYFGATRYNMLAGLSEWTLHQRIFVRTVTADGVLAVQGTVASTSGMAWWCDQAATDKYAFLLNSPTTYSGVLYSSQAVTLNTWITATLVFRGGVNTRLYINGVEDGNSPFDTSAISAVKPADVAYIIGNDGGSIKDFDGQMGYIHWWNRALTQEQVVALEGAVPVHIPQRYWYVVSAGESVSLADDLSLADALSSLAGFAVAPADSITLADAVTPTAAFNAALAESVTLADVLTPAAAYLATLADSLTVADALSAYHGAIASLADTIGFADELTADAGNVVLLTDSIGLGDSIQVAYAANVVLTESLSIAEALAATGAFSVTLADSLTIADTYGQIGVGFAPPMSATEVLQWAFAATEIRHKYLAATEVRHKYLKALEN